MAEVSLNAIDSQQLTVDSTAGGVSLTMPTAGNNPRPQHALIYVGGADIRWLGGATAPTATLGILVAAGSYIDFTEPDTDFYGLLTQMRMIRATGVSATLDILYMN